MYVLEFFHIFSLKELAEIQEPSSWNDPFAFAKTALAVLRQFEWVDRSY